MFSRPDRSGWKPAPTSIRPATRPRVRISPASGRSTPLISFSSVDLPDPLKPSSATDSPCSIVKLTFFRASNVDASGLRRTAAITVSLMEWVCRKSNVLRTPSTMMLALVERPAVGGASEVLVKATLQSVEDELAERDRQERDPEADHAVEIEILL